MGNTRDDGSHIEHSWLRQRTRQNTTLELPAQLQNIYIAIIDHKNTLSGINSIEYEMTKHWTKVKEKPSFAHAEAKNRHIGGITLAIHPSLGRYKQPTTLAEDPRG